MLSAAHLVRETNSATGTSAFVLTGAVSGYRTFATGYGSSTRLVPYVAKTTTGSLQFEVGIGQFNGTTGITRFAKGVIDGSTSGAGALVSFASAPDVYVDAGAFAVPGLDNGTGNSRPMILQADCVSNAGGSEGVTNALTSGTGATVSWTTPAAGGKRPGAYTVSQGTTTTGSAAYAFGSSNASTWRALAFGDGACIFEAELVHAAASNGTDTFSTRAGFIDSAGGDSTNGAYFEAGGALANANWYITNVSASTKTTPVDTSIAVSTSNFQRLRIEVCPDGSRIDYFIDGTNVGNITTNIISGGGKCNAGVMTNKTAGTAAKLVTLDYMAIGIYPCVRV